MPGKKSFFAAQAAAEQHPGFCKVHDLGLIPQAEIQPAAWHIF